MSWNDAVQRFEQRRAEFDKNTQTPDKLPKDRDEARDEWILAEAAERVISITSDEVTDIISDLTAEQFDRTMARAIQRDPELRMIAHTYFVNKLEKEHGHD